MTTRLKVIIVVGVIAIAMALLLTRTPEQTTDDSAAYEAQLSALRAKQKPIEEQSNAASYSQLNKDSSSVTQTTQTVSTTTTAIDNGTAALTKNLSKHMNSTLESFKSMLPDTGTTSSAQSNDTQERITYLQTMPVSVIEATPRDSATNQARQDAGRANPFAEISPSSSFPRERKGVLPVSLSNNKKSGKTLGHGPDGLPPPAPDLPPPPPPDVTAQMTPLPGISSDELPPPPEKPLLMRKLRLNGIVGDHVILAFKDRNYQRRNGYKRYITLAQGQVFDNVKLIDVEQDKAVLEEDGEQTTVRLEPIR